MLYYIGSHSKQRQTEVVVVWPGDRSQVPTKAISQSTARTCHTRMVLPAAAGRQGCSSVVSWEKACALHATVAVICRLGSVWAVLV